MTLGEYHPEGKGMELGKGSFMQQGRYASEPDSDDPH